jgi:hypothetical protein
VFRARATAPPHRRDIAVQKTVARRSAARLCVNFLDEGHCMLLAPLFGATLVFAVATEPLDNAGAPTQLSLQQKMAATDPLVRTATDCIVHAVTTDPRYGAKTAALGDLIVDSMPTCLTPVRAMINAYDHYYGDGSGEAFFMGPYLDVLPKAVVEWANKKD